MIRMDKNQIRHIFTRLGLSVIFIAFGIWEILQPLYWVSFVPTQLGGILSSSLLVTVHGSVLLIVGLAVLLGFYLRIAAFLSILIMFEILITLIIVSGFSDLIIRDIVVLFLAIALFYDDTRYYTLNKN